MQPAPSSRLSVQARRVLEALARTGDGQLTLREVLGHVRQPKDRTPPDILQFHRVDASVSASDGASALLSCSAFAIFPDIGTSHRIPRNVCTAARGYLISGPTASGYRTGPSYSKSRN